MAGGGRLTISTRGAAPDEPGAAHDGAVPKLGWVVVEVADTGVGIPEEVKERVFDPFFTTKQRGKGTGLGLATVRQIVNQAEGCIVLDTRPNQGSTFGIYLPATDQPASLGAVVPRPPSGAPRGATVLVVDDDDAVRRAICRILSAEGYAVREARNGEDALAEHARRDGSIDLLLTDVVMPGMSGEELAAAVVERQPTIKVAYITGYATTTVITRSSESENRIVLPKPFRQERLLSLVREVLDVDA
jgi:CheY-like chemotaxis protein